MKGLLNILFLFFFLFCWSSLFGQNCADTSFKKLISAPAVNLSNYNYFITGTNDAILGGTLVNPATLDTSVYILKLSDEGKLVWSRNIKTERRLKNPDDLVVLDNGDMVFLFALSERDKSSFNLVGLNRNGQLLYSRNFTSRYQSLINNIKISSFNRNLYVTYLASTIEGPDDGISQNVVVKLDEHARVIWSKYYGRDYDCSRSFPTSILKDGDSLVVFGRTMVMGCREVDAGMPNKERSYFAMKLDDETGAIGKSISYLAPLEFGPTLISWSSENKSQIIKADDGTYYLSAVHFPRFDNRYGSYKLQFDNNLNPLNGTIFYHSDGGLPKMSNIKVATDGSGSIFFDQSVGNTYGYTVQFKQDNVPLRQMRLIDPTLNTKMYNGASPIAIKKNYLNIVAAIQSDGQNKLQLIQLANGVGRSDCFGEDTSFIKTASYNLQNYSSPFFDGAFDIDLIQKDFQSEITDLNIILEDLCEKKSTCTSLSITGNPTICDTSHIYNFIAQKNGACNSHVFWEICDPDAGSLKVLNDSMVSVRFNRNWQGYLYATTSSCADVRDSIKITVHTNPVAINLGRDTTLCADSFLVLHAGNGFKSYLWQDHSTDSILKVSQQGKYFVSASDYCGNNYADTIHVNYNEVIHLDLGKDTSVCSNTPLKLYADAGFVKYNWSGGDTTKTIIASAPGLYTVTVTDASGCVATDSIRIHFLNAPKISLDKNKMYCAGQNDTIHANSGFYSYLWQDGSTDSDIKVYRSGWYKVTVSDGFCYSSDSVNVERIYNPPAHFLPRDTSICSNKNFILKPSGSFQNYMWSKGSTASSISVNSSGTVYLKVEDEHRCEGIDSIKISIKDCSNYIFVPNSFSPNGDGVNDNFKPTINGNVEAYEFSVYNRFGQLVFFSKNKNEGWDGRFKGENQTIGAYAWMCSYKFANENKSFKKGTVMLLR